MKFLRSVLFAILTIPVIGALAMGSLVACGLAVRHYGSFGGFTMFIALILYVAVVVLPVSQVLQWLARKLI